ncbi:chromodomain containing protein [Aphelenchoides avenae]|nr:chromodomain containing protein [Aphelenchus avenae]
MAGPVLEKKIPYFAVEALLRRRSCTDRADVEYLVQFRGTAVSEAAWLSRTDLAKAHWLMSEFDRRNPEGADRQSALRWDDPDIQYNVERIEDERWNELRQRQEFLVKWSAWPAAEAIWEPRENLTNCRELLDEFERSRASGPAMDAMVKATAEMAVRDQAENAPGSSHP